MQNTKYIDEIFGHPEIKHGLTVFGSSELRGLNLLNKINIYRREDGKIVIKCLKRQKEIMHKILILLAASVIFVGCATTPIAPTAATQAPNDRILAFQQKTPSTTATLIITRDEGFLGGGCYYAVSINGTLAARLDVGETARFFLAPGEILLRSGRDPQGKGLCAVGQDEWTQRETILRQNEIKSFRLSIDMNGKTDIQRADQ